MNIRIQTGMVVVARVGNPLENPFSQGKGRPCIVVERQGGHIVMVGLTTQARFRSGAARVSIPRPQDLGLNHTSYLWSGKTCNVCALDVDDELIGWVTPEVAELICANVHLTMRQAQVLRDAARAHHIPLDPAA